MEHCCQKKKLTTPLESNSGHKAVKTRACPGSDRLIAGYGFMKSEMRQPAGADLCLLHHFSKNANTQPLGPNAATNHAVHRGRSPPRPQALAPKHHEGQPRGAVECPKCLRLHYSGKIGPRGPTYVENCHTRVILRATSKRAVRRSSSTWSFMRRTHCSVCSRI